MGKVYKSKKGSSCKLCKPHKNGWKPKKKRKVIGKEKDMELAAQDEFYNFRGQNFRDSQEYRDVGIYL